MKAYRASLLRFHDDGQAVFETDGLLVTGPDARGRRVVLAAGSYRALAARHADVPVEHLPGRILAPGFLDLHIHYPQTDVIGSPAEGLLPWLENYTFPHESRFADAAYAQDVATVFLDEWLIPVASPEFLARHSPITTPEDLHGDWLLHDGSAWDGADTYEEWQHWFAQRGAPPPPWAGGQQFNLSQLALGAALAGQGIAMGRAALVLQDVKAGRLMPLLGPSVPSRAAYSVVTTTHPSPAMELVREWLLEEARRFGEERAQVLPAPAL